MTSDAARTTLERILDDLHRQGGHLEVSQVERAIIRRELNAEEAAFVYDELSARGVTPTESDELRELLARPLSRSSDVPWDFNFGRMLSEAREYRPLTRAQEVQLGRRVVQARKVSAEVESGQREPTLVVDKIIARGEDARVILAKSNLRFVVSVARGFEGKSSLGLEDLVQEGILGLMRAVDRFDPNRDIKFISYAVYWIRATLIEATSDVGRTVRIPLNVASEIARMIKVRGQLTQLNGGHSPDLEELATTLGWEEARVQFLTEVTSYRSDSLETPVSEDSSIERKDLLPSREPSPEALLMSRERTSTIRAVLENLTPRDREVVILYFGLNGEEPMTLERIGTRFGVTRERIRQLRNRALKRLREYPQLHEFYT